MWPKHKQPYIGRWSLPNGKIHFEDASVEDAIKREITYLTKDIPRDLKNIGVIEYRTYISDHLVSHSIAHIFTAQIDSIYHQYAKWIDIKNVDSLKLTPSTAETIFFAQNEKQYFYKKLDIEW
jgi:ADP-ribose pyrophosphatase YjhB (NUDIX family)